jgi:hypothetical protein
MSKRQVASGAAAFSTDCRRQPVNRDALKHAPRPITGRSRPVRLERRRAVITRRLAPYSDRWSCENTQVVRRHWRSPRG